MRTMRANMKNPADALNATLQSEAPAIYSLLSQKGKAAFFPHGGILGQSAQAKGKRYNATIGIALEEDGSPMRLSCMTEELEFPPKDIFPYASSFGKQELRELWKGMIYDKNPSLKTDITMPVVTAALTHGLTVAGYLFLDEGDDVILTDCFWGNYKLTFSQQFGANLKTFPIFEDGRFAIEQLKNALLEGASRKRIVLLNFPNNPTGYTPTKTEAEQIVETLVASAEAGDQLAVLLDDAYFGLVYEDNVERESLFARLADAHENILAVKIDGATKEDYAWGFRIGFLTYGTKGMTPQVAKVLEDKTAGVVRGTISNCCHISQSVLTDAYRNCDYWRQKEEKSSLLRSRYDAVKDCVNDARYGEYFRALPFNSGYFMCIALCDELDAEAVRQKLLDEFDTGVIAVGNLIRIAYSSLPTEDIAPLFENLYLACKALSPALHHEPVAA